ncbi:hypothetical protein ABIF68_007118 [Bradyrhizobium japonicum]|uniref:hypothetical protein n=1 Tax=Bradyrhizobium TaxID=374 RepID=UPI0012FE4A33|nr:MULTISPECIES: hypothetical protein [Bradyrhizobium]MBR0948275.1 hypothetical protein [Bradyrhizobium liaoningense]MDI2071068.1 hypothetical protein [Bradyrhizobium sp. Mp27]
MTQAADDNTDEHPFYPPIRPVLSLFVFLNSFRNELLARQRAPIRRRASATGRLPRYVERNPRNGKLAFRVYPGSPRTPLPSNPTTPEFRRAYNAALVDAIASEKDERISKRSRGG